MDYLRAFALPTVCVAAAAYLLGSISFSILFTKLFGHNTDIRALGSGNAGATNVLRSVGVKAAVFTFVFDFLKGAASVQLGRMVFQHAAAAAGAPIMVAQYGAYLGGVLCVIGHIFPLYFQFRGGKGVLTSAAMVALIDWRVFLLVISVFVLVLVLTRIVSLSSVCAAASFPVATFLITYFFDYRMNQPPKPQITMLYVLVTTLIAVLMAVILIVKHKDNLIRLKNGTEKKLSVHRNP